MKLRDAIYKLFELAIIISNKMRLTWIINDEFYLKAVCRIFLRYRINLKNPETFNEKLQWLKLNYRLPIQTLCADKLKMRDYIKEKVGEKYVIPVLGVYDDVSEIDFSSLPETFVLKTNHDSGGVVVCHNKQTFNEKKAIKKLRWSLKRKYYYLWREWPYKNIIPRIICEEKLGDTCNLPADYKILCFNGEAKLIEIHTDRETKHNQVIYDVEGNLYPFNNVGYDSTNAEKHIDLPFMKEMIDTANIIAKDFVHIRVDFFAVNNNLKIGELTFSDGGGVVRWNGEGDIAVGKMLDLNIMK